MTDASPPQPKLQIRIIPVTPLQQNCSLIWSEETKNAAFVDPGHPENPVLEPGGDRQFLPFAFLLAALAAAVGLRLIYLAAG